MPETIFVWDPVNDCVISELDGSGAVQVTYTNEPQQYGGVISQRRGTTTSTYHADALGSTRALTNNSGNVTDTYLNDAWGVPVASTGTTVNPFRWVGKYGYYTDNSTAQVYVRARMYQPTVARWTCYDPLIFRDGPNRLLYARNNPSTAIDPAGLMGWTQCLLLHSGNEFNCDYGTIHASPIKPTADGVTIGLHLEESMLGCCPSCDSYRWIQVVTTNWAQPFFDGPSVKPRYTFVDNGNNYSQQYQEPWYGGYSNPGKGRPNPSDISPAEFDFQPSVASMWDSPTRNPTAFNGPNNSYIPLGDGIWQAVACVVCVRPDPLPDVILDCVHWGFRRERKQQANGPRAFGPPQPIGPTCLGPGAGPCRNTNSLMALFRHTLDYDEVVNYDYLEEYTFDSKEGP